MPLIAPEERVNILIIRNTVAYNRLLQRLTEELRIGPRFDTATAETGTNPEHEERHAHSS